MKLLPRTAEVSRDSRVLLAGTRIDALLRAADAGGARQPHLDDLPGADVVAEPDLQGRQPDRRGDHPAPAADEEAGARPRARAPEGSAHPRTRSAARAVPASALRRPAPARDDRHRDRQQPRIPHRRRADHRARRDCAGGNPEAHPPAAKRLPYGRALDHPRPHHRGESQRQRSRHAARPGRRDERDAPPLRRTAEPLHEEAPRLVAVRQAQSRRAERARSCCRPTSCGWNTISTGAACSAANPACSWRSTT